MDIRKRVALIIKDLRQNLKLTQETLTLKLKIDKTYVNEVECGRQNVSVIYLEKIRRALDVTELLDRDLLTKEVIA